MSSIRRSTRARWFAFLASAVLGAGCGEGRARKSIVEGNASFQAGDFAQALRHFDRALKLEPESAEALEGRGRALVQIGRLAEALADFDRVVELLPTSPSHFNRGSVLSAMSLQVDGEAAARRLIDARAAFERALELDPNNAEAQFRLGLTLRQLGLPGDLASFERAIELQPDHVQAHLYRGITLETEAPEEALAEFERVLRMERGNVHAHYWRAIALYGFRRREEAALALDRAIELGADKFYPGVALEMRATLRAELERR